MFPSKRTIERHTARQLADMFHMHLCALMIVYSSPFTEHKAKDYARRTLQRGDFVEWQSMATDLSTIGWALMDEDVDLRLRITSANLRERLTFDPALIRRWIKSIKDGSHDHGLTQRLFTRMDYGFRVTDASMKAVRRLVMDWKDLDAEEASLATTRLLQLMRHNCPNSDLLKILEELAEHHRLEIRNACDPDGNENCQMSEPAPVEAPKKKSSNLFARIGAAALGGVAGYKLSQASRIKEDATVGATCSTAIAAVDQPLGGVQRRSAPAWSAVAETKPTKHDSKKRKNTK